MVEGGVKGREEAGEGWWREGCREEEAGESIIFILYQTETNFTLSLQYMHTLP